MSMKISALLKNNTWTLVPPNPSMNILGCKWVFRIKRNSSGAINRFKTRLVAKGFHQQEGHDYFETFSPVVKSTTIQIILSIVSSKNWTLRQLDMQNAFLHGDLQEDVFMLQPLDFSHPQLPHYVCKLNKSLYGLKQAPRLWYMRLYNFFYSFGLHKLKD